MYPVRLGFETAISRIEKLSKNGHHAESLVTTVFTCEKTLRRTLRFLIVSCGFKSLIAEKIINNTRGLEAIKTAWEYYDPDHKKLSEIINPKDLQIISECAKIRNELVHGIRVYKLDLCESRTEELVESLKNVKKTLEANYYYCGWTPMVIRRKSVLHTDTRIKVK